MFLFRGSQFHPAVVFGVCDGRFYRTGKKTYPESRYSPGKPEQNRTLLEFKYLIFIVKLLFCAAAQSVWKYFVRIQVSVKDDLDYVEYRIIRKDGEIRWIEDYGHFVRTRSSGDIFYVFIGDATEKKEQLQQWRASLLDEQEQAIKNLIENWTSTSTRRYPRTICEICSLVPTLTIRS